MTFLASAGDALGSVAEKHADKWLDQGIANLRSRVLPNVPDEGAGVAQTVIAKLEGADGRAALSSLTHRGVVEMVGYLSLGSESEARFVYLRDVATFEEAQDALKAAMGAALSKNRQNEAEWQRTKAFLLDLLVVAGKVAITLLLAMV